jgi:hypothetical protein
LRYDHVGPHSWASVDIDAEHAAAGEGLLDLLPSRVLVEGVNGQLGLDPTTNGRSCFGMT